MAAAAPPPPAGREGLAPVNPPDLAAALQRLGNLDGNIADLHRRSGAFRTALQGGLYAIQVRIAAITAVMPDLKQAESALEALQHQVVASTPDDAVVGQLQAVIDTHDQLEHKLGALQQAVKDLETAVGAPPLQPPVAADFASISNYTGGYKNTSRARTARAKRLKTRKLHSRQHSRHHRRRRRRRKKKRTRKRPRRKQRR